MSDNYRLVISGDWNQYNTFLNTAIYSRHIEREIRLAMIKSCLFIIKAIKQEIRGRNFAENKPLTLALAKGTLPLLKSKNLWDAIEYKLNTAFQAEIGIIRNTQSTGGVTGDTRSMYKIAELMHTGYTIKVTPKMITAILAALSNMKTKSGRTTAKARSMIKQINTERKFKLPGKRSKIAGNWRVRPRPYMERVMSSPDVYMEVRKNWKEALIAIIFKYGC